VRHHRRRLLPRRARRALVAWQGRLAADLAAELLLPIAQQRTPGEVAEARWATHRRATALNIVARVLATMASPLMERCMYCEHDGGSEIDHAEPKSRAHHRTFEWTNHIWSCARCNRDKAVSYDPLMVDPTREDPLEALLLTAEGRWVGRDAAGRGLATLRALPSLNRQQLVQSRALGRKKLLGKLSTLADRPSVTAGEFDDLRDVVTNEPFSDVFAAVLAGLRRADAAALYPPSVVAFVDAHPEMYRWLARADERRWRQAKAEIHRLAARIRP
jgi:5-methylcytosine-specific restriction endonuclease McrA